MSGRRRERLLCEDVWEEISPVVETRAMMDCIGTEERLLTALVSSLQVFSSSGTEAGAGGVGRRGSGGGSNEGGRTTDLATGRATSRKESMTELLGLNSG